MSQFKKTPYYVLIITFIFGVIGVFLNQSVFADYEDLSREQLDKFLRVVSLVKYYYVEDVKWETAVQGAISGMLSELDPHSVYIEPRKVERNKEDFSGKYEGIGIEFDVIDGYITVISPIAGSPADQLGLRSGDRIIKIDGKSAIGISREEVPKKLKGAKGTQVNVTILREGMGEPFDLTITRDVIPIYTVTTKFMTDDSTGYVWVNRFAATTSSEVEEAIQELLKNGMTRLVMDMRGNPGGYLHEAVKLTGMFIPGHQLIVETRGRNSRVEEKFYADQWNGGGKSYDFPLVVMIDRGSASASEIVSGAIQDYDRGVVIGTNSFGKGLVQKEFPLQDGSAVRVTTARYYTPSGRLIQRDYKDKDVREYYSEVMDTSWTSEDSLKNRPQYHTKAGRIVYGGGGIRPDIIIAYNSYSRSPKMMNRIFQKRGFFEFAKSYATRHPEIPTNLGDYQKNFEIQPDVVDEFKNYCLENDIEISDEDFEKDLDYIAARIKSEIARHFWEKDGFYYTWLHHDNQFLEALNSFDEANRIAMLNQDN
ncbi:MAG: S41 family peptidase [Calditrichaeota bacterium]|nr:S41 family peptidase [Calditrichota bacterium]RQW00742.1 MAG: S41 family peptidase [Calditrichota bacterium]